MSSHPEKGDVERSEPTALSGLATSTCSAFQRRMEDAIRRRLDCLVQIRELKAEVDLLNDSLDDITKDWKDTDNWEWIGWALQMPDCKRPIGAVYQEWEQDNPEWQAVGNGIRKRRRKNEADSK